MSPIRIYRSPKNFETFKFWSFSIYKCLVFVCTLYIIWCHNFFSNQRSKWSSLPLKLSLRALSEYVGPPKTLKISCFGHFPILNAWSLSSRGRLYDVITFFLNMALTRVFYHWHCLDEPYQNILVTKKLWKFHILVIFHF